MPAIKQTPHVPVGTPRKDIFLQLIKDIDKRIAFFSARMDEPALTRSDKLLLISQLHRLSVDRSELQMQVDGLHGEKLGQLQRHMGEKMQSGVSGR